jgi:hypothetical protein
MKHILITNTEDIKKILSLFGSTKRIKVCQNLNKKQIKEKLYLFRLQELGLCCVLLLAVEQNPKFLSPGQTAKRGSFSFETI